MEAVEQPGKNVDRISLCRDLKALLAAQHHRLQHFVGRNVSLEVARIPQLPDQLSKPFDSTESKDKAYDV